MTDKEKILKYLEYKGIKKANFYHETGLSMGFLDSGSSLVVDKLRVITDSYPDLNIKWFFDDTQPMINEDNYHTSSVDEASLAEPGAEYNQKQTIPLLPVDAYGGTFNGSVQVLNHEAQSYVIPVFSGADFLIPVKGNSMYPKYNSGDLVACKKVGSSTFFQWGKVYVISSEQGVLIKRVMQSNRDGSILLVSENADQYPAFELPVSEIHSLAIVIGVVRLE